MQALPVDAFDNPGELSLSEHSLSEQLGKAAWDHRRRGRPKKALMCLKRAFDLASFADPTQQPHLVLDKIRARLGLCAVLSQLEHHREASMHASEAQREAESLLYALPNCWDLPPDEGGFRDERHAVRFASEVDQYSALASHCVAIENAFQGDESAGDMPILPGSVQKLRDRPPMHLTMQADKSRKKLSATLSSGAWSHSSTALCTSTELASSSALSDVIEKPNSLPPLVKQPSRRQSFPTGFANSNGPSLSGADENPFRRSSHLPRLKKDVGGAGGSLSWSDPKIPTLSAGSVDEAQKFAETGRKDANKAIQLCIDFEKSLGDPFSRTDNSFFLPPGAHVSSLASLPEGSVKAQNFKDEAACADTTRRMSLSQNSFFLAGAASSLTRKHETLFRIQTDVDAQDQIQIPQIQVTPVGWIKSPTESMISPIKSDKFLKDPRQQKLLSSKDAAVEDLKGWYLGDESTEIAINRTPLLTPRRQKEDPRKKLAVGRTSRLRPVPVKKIRKVNAFQDFRSDIEPNLFATKEEREGDWLIRQESEKLKSQKALFKLHVSGTDPDTLRELKVYHSPAARSMRKKPSSSVSPDPKQSWGQNATSGPYPVEKRDRGDKNGILHLAASLTHSTGTLMKQVDGEEKPSFKDELKDLKQKFKKLRCRAESEQKQEEEFAVRARNRQSRHSNAASVFSTGEVKTRGAGAVKNLQQNHRRAVSSRHGSRPDNQNGPVASS